MGHSSTFANVWQRLNFTRNSNNDLAPHSSSQLRTVAATGAILLVSASAALGSYYGFVVGSHQHVLLGIVFAGAALGGELLKPFAVHEAITSFGRWHVLRGVACLLLATVCVIYSLAAELSLAAGSRGDLAASRQVQAQAVAARAGTLRRAQDELSTLPASRPAKLVKAEIDRLLLTPGAEGCVQINGRVTREICPKVASLKSELAIAERRVTLERTIAKSGNATVEHVVQSGDPLAGAVAVYAGALGWSWSPEAVLPWLALIPVLFLEIGSALAVVVVRSVGGPPPQIPVVDEVEVVQAQPVKRRSKKPQERALGAMADRLQRAGGIIEGSQRQLAKKLGTSKTTVHRAIHGLVAAGLATASVSQAGTRLVLA